MRNYLHTGDIVTVPAPYALAGGDGCQVVALFGVATGAAASGAAAEIKTSADGVCFSIRIGPHDVKSIIRNG